MKRIVILRCLGSNNVCTGAACLKAFNKKNRRFRQIWRRTAGAGGLLELQRLR